MFVLKQKQQHSNDGSWWIASAYYTERYRHIRTIDLEIEECI